MSVIESFRRQPQWLVLLEALALVALIGWLDYVTGWEWSFFVLFALPTTLVTWKTGWRLGFAYASLCTLAFWVAHVGRNPYHTGWGFAAAVFGRPTGVLTEARPVSESLACEKTENWQNMQRSG